MKPEKIRLFIKPFCGWCHEAMEWLDSRGIKYEVLDVTDAVKEMILMGASAHELKKQAIEDGMITLRQSGLRKVRDGVTTIDEVLRESVL